jgi:hypothetical protein
LRPRSCCIPGHAAGMLRYIVRSICTIVGLQHMYTNRLKLLCKTTSATRQLSSTHRLERRQYTWRIPRRGWTRRGKTYTVRALHRIASLGKKTIYMEDPSPRVDQAWEDLYGTRTTSHRIASHSIPTRVTSRASHHPLIHPGFGISWLTPHEASLLPNATSRLVEDPSHYVSGLDVFHQLHCLDLIRKHLYRTTTSTTHTCISLTALTSCGRR